MKPEMQKANMLADNINSFIKYAYEKYENKHSLFSNRDKLYQIILLIEEFKFQIIADELLRINRFEWDEKYTLYLVNKFKTGIDIIDEYVRNHSNDLFLLSGRIHTLKNLSFVFTKRK